MVANTKIEIYPDLTALGRRAAVLFASLAGKSVSGKGRFAVALSGGSTPKGLYSLLGHPPYRDEIDWSSVHFFWADERCVHREDEASNFKLAFDQLLSKIPVPGRNIHRIKSEKGPELGAKDYEQRIREFFGASEPPRFDLILLGMGEDGHTASLFPGSGALRETKRHALPVHSEKPGIDRITLTLPVLNRASEILFLVSGLSKAAAVELVLAKGDEGAPLPAALVRPPEGEVTWLIDAEAASLLEEKKETDQ
jgi:6-phosphogluconolactonase